MKKITKLLKQLGKLNPKYELISVKVYSDWSGIIQSNSGYYNSFRDKGHCKQILKSLIAKEKIKYSKLVKRLNK